MCAEIGLIKHTSFKNKIELLETFLDVLHHSSSAHLVFLSDLRRSPRIKKFARRQSNAFYSSSQPRSRNLDRALSASQLTLSDGKISGVNVKTVRSPMRLLFGAADSPSRPSDQSYSTRATRSRLSTDSSVFEVSAGTSHALVAVLPKDF